MTKQLDLHIKTDKQGEALAAVTLLAKPEGYIVRKITGEGLDIVEDTPYSSQREAQLAFNAMKKKL